MWGMTCEYQPQHQTPRRALRATTFLVVAEFCNASHATRPWQSASDCLEQSGAGLAERLLKHALVETFIEESAIIIEYLGREAKYIWNSEPLGVHECADLANKRFIRAFS